MTPNFRVTNFQPENSSTTFKVVIEKPDVVEFFSEDTSSFDGKQFASLSQSTSLYFAQRAQDRNRFDRIFIG